MRKKRSMCMASAAERYSVIEMAHRIACRVSAKSAEAGRLYEWVEQYAHWISFSDKDEEERISPFRKGERRSVEPTRWKSLKSSLVKFLKILPTGDVDARKLNLAILGRELRLEEQDCLILDVMLSRQTNFLADGLWDQFAPVMDYCSFLGLLTNLTRSEVQERLLSRKAALAASGIIAPDNSPYQQRTLPEISQLVVAAVQPPAKDESDISQHILGAPLRTELSLSDFSYAGTAPELLERIIKGAVERKEPGVNVLIYGPPGTGKTELCKALAQSMNLPLYAVGETDSYGREPRKEERHDALRLFQALLGRNRKGIILCDEMEDFWMQHLFERDSRVFAHRMLEENPIPVLWTCNHIRGFDSALIRRMTFALHLKTPPVTVRTKIVTKMLADNQVCASEEDIRSFVGRHQMAPGIISNAAKAARLAAGGFEQVRLAAESLQTAMSGGSEKRPGTFNIADYAPELACADTDAEQMATRLIQSGKLNFSACFYGPPGTGKSAYARYLAKRLGLEVIQKRASDLLSMWVGGTEQNIASAFAEARENRAILIFDEADSLIADRRQAHHSWEVSQVNEMLTWMEDHPYPFICTTNLMERLDAASLRRFHFKVKFDYLDCRACSLAFKTFFSKEPPSQLKELRGLTPGDFAVVQKKAAILCATNDTGELLSMLKMELEAKNEGIRRQIGFVLETNAESI